jgi:hypothetical protein
LLGHFVHDDCKAALTDAVSLLDSTVHSSLWCVVKCMRI